MPFVIAQKYKCKYSYNLQCLEEREIQFGCTCSDQEETNVDVDEDIIEISSSESESESNETEAHARRSGRKRTSQALEYSENDGESN